MKIKLTIAGKEVELTAEEAKSLHAELSKVFAPVLASPELRREEHHHHYPWISPALIQPVYVPVPPIAEYPRFTCGTDVNPHGPNTLFLTAGTC